MDQCEGLYFFVSNKTKWNHKIFVIKNREPFSRLFNYQFPHENNLIEYVTVLYINKDLLQQMIDSMKNSDGFWQLST